MLKSTAERLAGEQRQIGPASTADQDLGPFQQLPGTWSNLPDLPAEAGT